MTWGEYIDYETKDAKAEGKCEAMREVIIEILSELGTIPDDLTQKINASTDMKELKKWHKTAINVDSISTFESMM